MAATINAAMEVALNHTYADQKGGDSSRNRFFHLSRSNDGLYRVVGNSGQSRPQSRHTKRKNISFPLLFAVSSDLRVLEIIDSIKNDASEPIRL